MTNVKQPPPLTSVYSSSTAKDPKNQAKTEDLAKTIKQFHDDSFTKTFQAVQADHNAGRDATQNETALAADIATLHGLEQQFTQASGINDPGFKNANFTTEATSDDILKAAGSAHTSKDFTYTGSGSADGASQSVTANFSGKDKGVSGQATNSFSNSGQGVNVNTGAGGSSNPNANVNFSITNASSTVQGGVYSATQGQAAFNKLTSNPDQRGALAALSPQERADAYTYQTGLTGQEKAATIQNPAAIRLSQYQTGANASQARTDTDSYNAVVSFFKNQV